MRALQQVTGRSLSTLSDELRRNQVRGIYDPKKAHHKAYVRRKYSKYQGMKIVRHGALRDFVETELLKGQSPKNLSGRITHHETHLPSVSKESLYRFIKSPYGRKIEAARTKPKRRGRGTTLDQLQHRKFIEERPKRVENRIAVGDAEADFVVSGKGGKGILLVVVDRAYRTVFLERIVHISIEAVHQAFLQIQKRFPELQTITTDNDILFQKHPELEQVLHVKIFFCHPYHSWEKGSVENVNKYIRKDIPKGSDLSRYSKRFIAKLEKKLNGRFMACLQYETPEERLKRYRKNKKQRRNAERR